MYNDHLRLIGKRIVIFLLVLIELFSLRLRHYEQQGPVGPKFQVEGVAPPTILLPRNPAN